MDNFSLLYKVSVRLDCETRKVFQLAIAREKKKKENCVNALLEWRTEKELAQAFDENYIKCGYVPQFVVDHCRSMLKQQIEPSRISVHHSYGGTIRPSHTPRHLSLTVREKHPVELPMQNLSGDLHISLETAG